MNSHFSEEDDSQSVDESSLEGMHDTIPVMRTIRYKKGYRRLWSPEETQKLIQLSEKMIKDGEYSLRGLARLFIEQYSDRSLSSVLTYASRLVLHGVIMAPDRKAKRKDHERSWTDREIQFLKSIMNNAPKSLTQKDIALLFIAQSNGPKRSVPSIVHILNTM